jgi:hypothetical protein
MNMNLDGRRGRAGDLPGRMKTIALIDTRSEVPGETLGILVSTHPRREPRIPLKKRSMHPNDKVEAESPVGCFSFPN